MGFHTKATRESLLALCHSLGWWVFLGLSRLPLGVRTFRGSYKSIPAVGAILLAFNISKGKPSSSSTSSIMNIYIIFSKNSVFVGPISGVYCGFPPYIDSRSRRVQDIGLDWMDTLCCMYYCTIVWWEQTLISQINLKCSESSLSCGGHLHNVESTSEIHK